MVILHVATVKKDLCSGVSVAVMQYLENQSKIADVALINEKNDSLCDSVETFKYSRQFKLDNLRKPFNKPDIIIFHEMYSFAYLKIYKQAVKRNIPYVIIPHGGLTKTAQRIKFYKKIPANILFSKFYKNASCFQYLTLNEKNNSIFQQMDYFIAPNGVKKQSKRDFAFESESISFTYIGRLDIVCKGLDLLIEAIFRKSNLIRSKKASFHLYGPIHKGFFELKEMISAHGLTDIVSLNGPVVENEKRNVLLNTSFFIQTSRSEGLPFGILEALSFGIPCCLTHGTSVTETIKKFNAGFCSENDSDSIGKMIEEAIFCTNYQSLSDGASRIIEEKYSWDIVAKTMIHEYQNIIDKKKNNINDKQ